MIHKIIYIAVIFFVLRFIYDNFLREDSRKKNVKQDPKDDYIDAEYKVVDDEEKR